MSIVYKAIRKIQRMIGLKRRNHMIKKWRKTNQNKDFSIICSNCVGGIIYNDLGMKFLSPTINMYMSNLDFIKFASDLKHYCSVELEFIETKKPFPVAKLGDITLNFNHSNTPEDAADDWNRRKQRINYDNIYLIFYHRDGYTLDQIRQIEAAPYKKVAVLTHVPLNLDYAVYMKGNGDPGQNFLEFDKMGFRTFEKEWDFVSWLNS